MLIFDDVPPGTRRLQYERQTQGRMLVPNPETGAEAPEANDRVIPLSRYRYGPRIVMSGDTATVHVTGPLDSYWGFEAARMSETLDALEFQRVVLQVATPGGYVEEAARVYADLTARKDAGIRVDSVAAGFVASAGIPLFAVGQTRTALPGAGFMAHAPYVLAFAAMGRRDSGQVRPADRDHAGRRGGPDRGHVGPGRYLPAAGAGVARRRRSLDDGDRGPRGRVADRPCRRPHRVRGTRTTGSRAQRGPAA